MFNSFLPVVCVILVETLYFLNYAKTITWGWVKLHISFFSYSIDTKGTPLIFNLATYDFPLVPGSGLPCRCGRSLDFVYIVKKLITPWMLIRFIPKLILIFVFRPPISVLNFSHEYACNINFCKVCKKKKLRKKKKRTLSKVWLLVSQEWLKESSSSNLDCGLSCVERTINLVLFGSGIIELRMRENCKFIIPVNILNPFVRAPFSWTAQHTIMCLDTV